MHLLIGTILQKVPPVYLSSSSVLDHIHYSTASYLNLRGGGGGDDGITRPVVYSLLANVLALHMMRSAELLIATSERREKQGMELRGYKKLVAGIVRHLVYLMLAFLSYYVVYMLTGFVPMGYL